MAFDSGTLVVEGPVPPDLPPQFEWDSRVERFRAPAVARRPAVQYMEKRGLDFEDASSESKPLDLKLRTAYSPHPYQKEAFDAWAKAGKCGTVVLPTGAGKTFVALGAIKSVSRSALVVAPTIDLMSQWYSLLVDSFGIEVGILGGGYHEIRDITVTTYDSAYIHAADYGNRFDLVVFDEVHHLPSPKFQQIPMMSTAWCRLGLTATYERQDGAHEMLEFLIGPVVYRRGIGDLKGEYLSDYETVRIRTALTGDEADRYNAAAACYFGFLKKSGLKPFGAGWAELIKMSAYDEYARKALIAKREMKRIVVGSERKLEVLDSLLKQHFADKVIIFTEHNDLVYRISREFLIPAITHQTKARERKWILDGFKADALRAIVTSKVLNEGVDVPSAKIAIILSGSASPREHLQRLGRILRKGGDRRTAVLYEVVTSATTETGVSARRRKTDAYA
jgi:superfamily II DNA or RNA helicase